MLGNNRPWKCSSPVDVLAVSLQLTTITTVNSRSDNRKHFFDNPHRYDSEAEEIYYGSLHRSRYVLVFTQAVWVCIPVGVYPCGCVSLWVCIPVGVYPCGCVCGSLWVCIPVGVYPRDKCPC